MSDDRHRSHQGRGTTSRPQRILLACLLGVLLLASAGCGGQSDADQTDEARELIAEEKAVANEMAALSPQIGERWAAVGKIDPTAKNAADALPLLVELEADHAELAANAESVAALMDEVAALHVSEELKTSASLQREYAESWIEFCALMEDAIGKLKILYDPVRMSKLSPSDREKLRHELADIESRQTDLMSQVSKTQQAARQYDDDRGLGQ